MRTIRERWGGNPREEEVPINTSSSQDPRLPYLDAGVYETRGKKSLRAA